MYPRARLLMCGGCVIKVWQTFMWKLCSCVCTEEVLPIKAVSGFASLYIGMLCPKYCWFRGDSYMVLHCYTLT